MEHEFNRTVFFGTVLDTIAGFLWVCFVERLNNHVEQSLGKVDDGGIFQDSVDVLQKYTSSLRTPSLTVGYLFNLFLYRRFDFRPKNFQSFRGHAGNHLVDYISSLFVLQEIVEVVLRAQKAGSFERGVFRVTYLQLAQFDVYTQFFHSQFGW